MQNPKAIKIIILDDHPLITDGVASLLASSERYNLVFSVHSWESLLSAILEYRPDILILDLNIHGKNILNKIDDLKLRFPEPKILVFSSYNTPSLVKKALSKDVDGYLLKDTTRTELLEALDTMTLGAQFIGERVAIPKKGFVKRMANNEIKDVFENSSVLSIRELEVVKYIVEGLESQQVAERMFISKHTVQSHRKNILKKLNLHSAAELVRYALKNGLV